MSTPVFTKKTIGFWDGRLGRKDRGGLTGANGKQAAYQQLIRAGNSADLGGLVTRRLHQAAPAAGQTIQREKRAGLDLGRTAWRL